MSTVVLPPQALPRWESLPPEDDGSTGVSPTAPMPLSHPRETSYAMHAAGPSPSRFSVWRDLESRADRLASYGALALGLGFVLGFLAIL